MIYIACDHGGLELKAAIIKALAAKGEQVTDLGTNTPITGLPLRKTRSRTPPRASLFAKRA